jgi:hypothetical protein
MEKDIANAEIYYTKEDFIMKRENYEELKDATNMLIDISQHGLNTVDNLLISLRGSVQNEEKGVILIGDVIEAAIKEYYDDHQEELNKLFEPYQKTIKPIFKLDGALGYSALFKENTLSSSTVNRFGIWLVGEFSQVLNEGTDSKYNNYINILLTSRYVNDGFNLNSSGKYFDENYNDFGGKIALDFGKFSFGYEFISRNGTIDSERSVGDIKFMISNNVSISGGFGKDFELEDNLVTVFGINWGFNMGGNKIPINK